MYRPFLFPKDECPVARRVVPGPDDDGGARNGYREAKVDIGHAVGGA